MTPVDFERTKQLDKRQRVVVGYDSIEYAFYARLEYRVVYRDWFMRLTTKWVTASCVVSLFDDYLMDEIESGDIVERLRLERAEKVKERNRINRSVRSISKKYND